MTCLQPATPLFTAMLPAPGPCCRHCGEVPPPVFVPRTWMGLSEVGLGTNQTTLLLLLLCLFLLLLMFLLLLGALWYMCAPGGTCS